MATDLYGRNIGDNVSVNQVNQQLLSPTQETKRPDAQEVNNDSDKKESALENLYDAINRVAEKIDSNASKDLDESKNWSKNIIDFHKDFRNTSRSEESGQKTQTGFLDLASQATQNLWVASQSQNTIWVGISKLSNNAVQEISKSFSMSDCCESLGEATNVVKGLGNLNSGVAEASKTVLSRAGGGGGGDFGGGGDSGSGDGEDDSSRRRRRRRSSSSDSSDFEMPDAGELTGAIARMSTLTGLASLAVNGFIDLHRSMVRALDIDPIQKIFSGQILEHNNFRESIRALVHEQEGFGASNRQIEKTFINLESSINAAGVGSAKFKTMYLKNLERGLSLATAEDNRYVDALAAQKKGFTIEQKESALRERKVNRLKSIQTTALSTASSLHMSSDAMNELFMNWHMNLGLSEQSLAEIGSHMKNVSRSTGVTGSQLEKAMISADGIMKNLKKAGVASTDATKRVTEFMAAAQKHGFEGAADMMNALGTRQGYHESSMRGFLGQAALMSNDPRAFDRLNMGTTLQTPDGMKGMQSGVENLTRKLFGQFENELGSVGMSSATMDVTKLSEVMQALQQGDRSAQQAAIALQRQFEGLGTNIGGVEQALKTFREETLSSSQRINKYSKELDSMKAQGLENTDAFKQMQKKLLEAQTGASQDIFGRIKSINDNKQGKTGEQLEKELKDSLVKVLGDEKSAAEWQSNLPAKASEAVSQMRERAKAEGLNFDDMLKEKGIKGGESQLTKGLLEGDALSNQAMTEIMQRVSREEKAGEDPITDLKKTLDNLHTMLAQKLDNVGFSLSDMVVKILYLAGYLGGILMTLAGGILALRTLQNIPGLLSGISGLFGGLNKVLGNPFEKIFGKGGKGPLGGLLGDCLPVCPPSGGTGSMMPRRPTGGAPVVPSSPTNIPGTGPLSPVSRPRNTTVLPGGPDYGGGGWAGAQGTQYQSPTIRDAATGQVTRRDMSRSDRRANAERYLDARRAAGQSGRGFGPRAGSGIRRVAPQGKGWMGLAGKIANFAMANPTLTGTAIGATTGAVHGYATSDEKGWGAVGDSLFEGAVGGGIGAAAGYGAGRLGGAGKGLQAGGLPGIAGGAMDVVASGANMMGMPGFGSDCMPVWVCNFNEMGGMGGLLPGMGGGGMAQTALDTLNTVDMASDVAGMMGKGKNVAQVADKVDDAARIASKVAGGADDAAKGGSWLSKMFGGGNKAATTVASGADDAAKGGSWLSKMFGGGNKAATAVAGGADDAAKGVGLLSKIPGAGMLSKIPGAGMLKGVGSLLGKVAAPLQLAVGGITGAMEAESAGRTTAEGAIYGALTGGAHKGSFASEALGIQKGGMADEALGVAGAAGVGAMTGAAIGSVVPVVGTAVGAGVGAVVGAGAELVKVFTAEESSMRDAVVGFASNMGSAIAGIPSTIAGGFNTVGSYIGEGAYGIYESITGFASGLGSTFNSGITSVASGISGFAENIGNTVSDSFASTAKENWDRMLQGASFSGALGQVTGGIVDVVNGNLTQGLTKIGLSGVEGFGALGQTILGAASSLNPFSWFKDKNKTPAKEAESSPEKKLAETTSKETQKTQQDVVTQSAEKLQEAANGIGLNIGKAEQDLKTISESYDGEIDLTGAMLAAPLAMGASKEISKALPTQNSEVFNSILAEQESLIKSISQRKLEKLNVNAVDVKDVQSSLQDSSNTIQKQSLPAETTTSLQGVFEKTQASEALTSNLDTALKWQKIDPSEQTPTGNISEDSQDRNNLTVYDQSVETILFKIFDQLKSFNLTGLFDGSPNQSMKNLDSASILDSQKKSLEQQRIFESFGVSVGEFEQLFKSTKDLSSLESSLQNSSNIIQKQSAPVETTTSLQGVFDKTQASEALTSNIDAAIKWQKIEPNSIDSDFNKKWNTLKDNEFDNLESKSSMKRMFGYDESDKQNKMSYQGTGAGAALGAALGGPLGIPAGAAAGFAYDAFSNNLNIQDALNQTISNIGENTKGVLNSLSLGLFDNEKASEAQDSSLEYSIKNIAPGLVAGVVGGVTGGLSSLASPMISQLMQGQASGMLQQATINKQINKPEVSSNQLGLFDNEKASEAQDSSLEYSIKNIAPSLIAGSIAGVTGGMSSFALPMINQLMQNQPNQKNIETSELLKEKFLSPEGFIEANPQNLGVFDFEQTDEAEQGYFKQLGASYVDPKDFMTTAPIPIVGDIINLLSNVGSKIFGSTTKGSVGMSSLGMFDPSQPSEANDSESDLMLKKIQGSQNFDLNRYNLNAIENSIKNKSNLEKNVVLETSRALDYDRQASEAADSAKINELDYQSDIRGDIESNPMDYTDDMGSQSISPTYMDYRDQMKGEVGTLGISRYGMESAVMQSKYGEQPTGNSSILPSMDTIASYLTGMQSTKLDMMIKHLQEIRDRLSTQTTSYSNIIGSAASGSKPPEVTGVKSIARDFISGKWDLPYGDSTPGTVNTEGRGGD